MCSIISRRAQSTDLILTLPQGLKTASTSTTAKHFRHDFPLLLFFIYHRSYLFSSPSTLEQSSTPFNNIMKTDKHECSSTDAMVDSPPKRKSVRFSRYSHSRVFRSIYEEDIRMKSYTKSDYKHFDRVRSHDIIKCSKMLAFKIGTGQEITSEDLCYCTGLETMLSPDLPRRFKKVRQLT